MRSSRMRKRKSTRTVASSRGSARIASSTRRPSEKTPAQGKDRPSSRGRSGEASRNLSDSCTKLADLLARDANVPTLALPLLAGRGLDLVPLLLGVAEEVPAAEVFERLGDLGHPAAAVDLVVEALRDKLRVGRHDLLNELEERHRLRHLAGEVGRVVRALVEDPCHARLDVRVERGVLHLVDLVERHERADLHVGELAVAEEFAEELEQPADRLVVPLRPCRPGAERGRDLEEQVDVPREHRVHLDKLVRGDLVAAVGIELEVGPVLLEHRAELRVDFRPLLEQPPVDDVADIRRGEVHAELGRKTVLRPDKEGVIGLLVELLLPEGDEPGLALEPGAEGRRERSEPIDAILVRQDVLRNLIDDEEERRPGPSELEHIADRGNRILRRLALGIRPGAAHVPAHRVGVLLRIKLGEHEREVLLSELLVLVLGPGSAEHPGGGFLEPLPLVVALELELEVGDERLGRAVAEPLLDLPDGRGVDLLVVAGDATDVEDDRERIDLPPQFVPGLPQFLRARGQVAAEQSLRERAAVGEGDAVEREPEELGEARLSRAVEPGDPGVR